MNTGLLWHDSTDKPTTAKVAEAAQRYARRFGVPPTACYVHPAQLPDGDTTVSGIAVKSSSRVLRNHFWIGVERDIPLPGHDAPAT